MCGICGFAVARERISESEAKEALARMTAQLRHRGPDQDGLSLFPCGDLLVGLGHRRLSIIDLSERGRQPMLNETGEVQIVFNGEIYNFRDLRPALERRGHRFSSNTDTEAILHQFEEEGVDCVNHLTGMFAFAIWDSRRQALALARDRVGIKPLFYARFGGGIIFSSEIKSMFQFPGFARHLRPEAVQEYLTFGYVPAPETIFAGIRSLEPGMRLVWTPQGSRIERYWRPDQGRSVTGTTEQLTDELDQRLNEAVQSHLVADVEVGAFLSGGLDSSLVAAIAARKLSRPIRAFTIGFGGGGDEREFARAASASFPCIHKLEMAEPELTNQLPGFLWHLEHPLFDNSVLPTFLVSALAARECKVVLSGDGGDEAFAGYSWTRAAASIPGLGLRGLPQSWKWMYRKGIPGLVQRGLYDLSHGRAQRYLRRMLVSSGLRTWLLKPEFSKPMEGYDPAGCFLKRMEAFAVRDQRERLPLADLAYLSDDILFKVDRMSMAHSLEVRVPLLDHQLLEWALALPWEMRMRLGQGKILLREVAKRYLPDLVTRPRKQGFTVPVGRWLQGSLGNQVCALLSSSSFTGRKMIRPDRALALLDLHRSGRFELGHRIWSLAVLEVWCRIWLDGQSHQQSFESMLKETGDWK